MIISLNKKIFIIISLILIASLAIFIFNSGPKVLTTSDGIRYEGHVKRGLPNGQGLGIWPNGDRYSPRLPLDHAV
ncbi:MAG: hypothetical protein LBI10_02565 [Deltaproteobacteria bacterium]|jgi:hypothetical protein|nr:hypothetical protein [Deltaproteobacteria bacterium]